MYVKKIKNHLTEIKLKGYIGRKPIIKKMSNGSKLARTTLAENIEFYTLEGKRKQETQWHSIIGWGNVADQIELYLDKGTPVSISGKIKNKHYIDEKGNRHTVTEIEVIHFAFSSTKKIA